MKKVVYDYNNPDIVFIPTPVLNKKEGFYLYWLNLYIGIEWK